MKSKISLLLALALTILSFFSCKKDKIYNVEGTWVGSYQSASNNQPQFISFNIKPGGTLDVMNNLLDQNQINGSGNWTLINGTFSTTITYGGGVPNSIFVAQFDTKTGTFNNETWGNFPSSTDGGTWTMTKK